jgi:two-component system chemotaxis sensor kinase CheA
LETNGFHVGIAVDGREGLELLQRERFDLVISDVEMPRMDGFALLAAMKQDDRLSSTPVVLVTSRDRGEDREKGLELGADAYIVKQKFDHQSWLNTIREIVGT